ncbi:MAG: Asp-tRNA(Asn)/Glu-tRNA(Gln) amidotransferase subunit GatA [Myxococcales bacterium]|nr:Asp-tRNA(Asn)/Glu-tRNA(Gln) amidotransferase subunit GatA [Myxococcales bacterium]
MSELWQLGLDELSACVARGEASCVEAVGASLDRVAAVDDQVGAFLSLRSEAALREASEADRARAKGAERGPLHGLPFAVKDNLVSPDFETSCASRILRGMRAPYEATVLARLRKAGMVALGTTNMDEFAMGSSCENSSVKPTRNPWDLARVPGGSSGGSAAAIAAREVPVALGSDTGGSIRQPAALCGVVGLKPTYGRVSRYGLVAFASSLDQVGPLTHSARDAALLLGVIAGNDPLDSTSLDAPVPDYTSELSGSIAGLRVGLPREFFDAKGLDPGTREALDAALATLEELGAIPVELSLPLTEYAIAAYYLICTAEASSNLSRYDGVKYGLRVPGDSLDEMYLNTRSSGFGGEVKRRILLGTFVLSAGYYDAYYRKAQQVRTLVRRDFEAAFERCDLIATPTTPGPAWPLGERVDDPLAMYLSDVFTVSVNLAGLPALSVPCGRSGRLPVGLQMIGRPLDEPTLLRAADAFLERTGFHRDVPELSGTTA